MKKFFFTYFQILKLVWGINRLRLSILLSLNFIWGITNIPVIYLNKAVIDLVISAISGVSREKIIFNLVVLIFASQTIYYLRDVFSRFNNALANTLGNEVSDKIQILIGTKLNLLDAETISDSTFQDKYNSIERNVNQRIWGMVANLQDVPAALANIISGLFYILNFNPWIVVLVFITNLPEILISKKVAESDYLSRQVINKEYRVLGWLSWIFTSTTQFYENQVLGNLLYVSKRMRGLQNIINTVDWKMRKTRAIFYSISDILPKSFSGLVNVYFFVQAVYGKISLGTAQSLFQSVGVMSSGINMAFNTMAQIYEHYLFVKDYVWFMELRPKIKFGNKNFPVNLKTGLVFENVWFRYSKAEQWILKNVNLVFLASEDIAIVGENGAGKSTLIKLLLGFYKPEKGRILLDGIEISKFDHEKYLKQISVLFQDFHLFPFSVQESIGISDTVNMHNVGSVKQAATLAKINDHIETLNNKYKTPLSKDLDGVDLSGGQKQRIGIARTLFKKAKIIILDEPTSAIDPQGEEEIFDNIMDVTKKQILILISHRFSTVRKAKKIILLEKGEVVEQGSHDDLMKQNGKYAHLFNLQAKSYQ